MGLRVDSNWRLSIKLFLAPTGAIGAGSGSQEQFQGSLRKNSLGFLLPSPTMELESTATLPIRRLMLIF